MPGKVRKDRCVNPYLEDGVPSHQGSNLRKVTKKILEEKPHLPKTAMVCNDCRLKRSFTRSHSISSLDDSSRNYDEIHNHGAPPTTNNSTGSVHSDVINCSIDNGSELASARLVELEELLQGLKDKFRSLDRYDPLKVRILTIAPVTWSVRKIATEFGTSRALAEKAKRLRSTDGVLAEAIARTGKTLPDAVIQNVVNFYNDDSISRVMTSMKDVVSVKVDEKRLRIQKRLLMMDLKELHELYKKTYQNMSISFSEFAKLRPQYCVLMGAKGTHSVCVCTIHQNCKMMLDAINLDKLTENDQSPIYTYRDCLKMMMCENPTTDCHLIQCVKCSEITHFGEKIFSILTNNSIETVQYSLWTATDRATLRTVTTSTADFADELCEKLQILRPHSFIAKQQSNFLATRKQNLLDGEVIVMFDFSENLPFHVQNAAPAFHFNNDQCTVFTVIFYYMEGTELKHKNCVFISESLKHDTAAVYTIQKQLIPEIKKVVKKVEKVIYMTDGAKQHLKNRFQMSNLLKHKEDFGIVAEWHFCPTAHGKSGYDGLGATFKREAIRASLLAKPHQAMLTTKTLFDWAKDHFKNIQVFYYSKVEHDRTTRHLNKRFDGALAVPQIMKNHSFTILSNTEMIIKRFSNDTKYEIFVAKR
ncbi:hypothetical protein QAD02_002682 [Eretmocerus hayati]|uniref:Uncharacterized protein n=1 Tax=Eretmocerus hayati TaxID=131215 RepID=A0ACC2NJP8_9HYME|nr:hypothetical protein QAD02_002682 [Eretmocerus hayati]